MFSLDNRTLEARTKIEITRHKIYLDHAGAGPLIKDVRERIQWFLSLWEAEGEPWRDVLKDVIRTKSEFAELIGAHTDEVAIVPSVTYGLNAVLSSIKFKPGSNVVVSPHNFPTGFYTLHALRRRGLLSKIKSLEETMAGFAWRIMRSWWTITR